MKLAYFDCQFGAAGDMLLGSLISAGLPLDSWIEELHKIDLPEGSFKVEVEDVIRCTIASKKLHVRCLESNHACDSHEHEEHPHHGHSHSHLHHAHSHSHEHTHGHHEHSHDHEHGHSHDHSHGHSHGHSHDRDHDHSHAHEHGHSHDEHERERSLKDILEIIDRSTISSEAKVLARKIFQRLGQAEARVHGVTPDTVHFHEVGAIDAIIDIVGFAIGYTQLKIDRAVVSPLPLGFGTVKTRHGTFPIPGPAVTLLLSDAHAPTVHSNIHTECLTPTGAAVLVAIADEWGTAPTMEHIESIGYGAGSFNPSEYPNVCRVMIGQTTAPQITTNGSAAARFNSEVVAVLETNLDDFSPQALAYAVDRLFLSGALDVYVVPSVMKKGRSGHLLTVVCKPGDRRTLESIILTETSSLGVRSYLTERLVAEREWKDVMLDGTKLRVKIGRDRQGNIINAHPEYEDCAAFAAAHCVPFKEAFARAMQIIQTTLLGEKQT